MTETKNRTVDELDLYDEDDEDSQKDKYLTFRIGKEDYGIEIAYVTEIVGIQTITEVPELPVYMKGVINLRGRVIPVIDVRLRFKMEERAYDDRTCVIVVGIEDQVIGLIVDTVNEVVTIQEDQCSKPPRAGGSQGGNFVRAMGKIGDSVKILLDLHKLLSSEELDILQSSTTNA